MLSNVMFRLFKDLFRLQPETMRTRRVTPISKGSLRMSLKDPLIRLRCRVVIQVNQR